MLTENSVVIRRGATVSFSTTFYDLNHAITQPAGAMVNIVARAADGTTTTVIIPMTPPIGPAVEWTAEWDSRGMGMGAVEWSIHTTTSPYAVEDGQFSLSANPANLVTF